MAFKFEAKIRKTGPLPTGGVNAYVIVPKLVVSGLLKLANKKTLPVPVKGTVQGKSYISTLVRYEKMDRLYLNMQIRRLSGVDIGDTAWISLQLDKNPRIETIPSELTALLKSNRQAKSAWDQLAPSRRREMLRYLNSLKTGDSRVRVAQKIIAHLTGQQTSGLHSLLGARSRKL